MSNESHIPHTSIHRIQADGVTAFYREAGPARPFSFWTQATSTSKSTSRR